jgi:hypothetical protein
MDIRYGRPGAIGAAVFVDVENMAWANAGAAFQVDRLMAHIQRESVPLVRRAYADWRALGLYADAFHEAAFDQVQVSPANGQKNSADIHLAVDAVETVIANAAVQRVYLVAGDSDYCPLVRTLRRHGREVVCIAWSNSLGEVLRHHADRVIPYENLVGIPVRQGLAEPAARPPSPPRRTLTLPRRAATSGGDDFVSVLDRFIAEAGEGARMAEEEARDRVLQLDPDATMAQGPAFRAWLLQHPRIRIVGGGDAAEVEILPGDGEEEEDGGAIDELNQALSAENLVFLGAEVQAAVVDTLNEVLVQRADPQTRAEALQSLRFRLREVLPDLDLDYDSLNSVFHIFYRAHAFQRFAAAGVRNAPLMLKLQYRDPDAFRQIHDRYVIMLATRQGLRWSAESWSEVLHGSGDFREAFEPLVATEDAGAPSSAEATADEG